MLLKILTSTHCVLVFLDRSMKEYFQPSVLHMASYFGLAEICSCLLSHHADLFATCTVRPVGHLRYCDYMIMFSNIYMGFVGFILN